MTEKECPRCRGTHWIIKKKGNREFAVKCDCQDEDLFFLRGEKANIPPRFLGSGLEWGYQPDKNNPSQVEAKKVVGKFIDEYPAVEKGLLVQGSIGLGKTSLLCSIGSELIKKKNVDVYYIDWNDLVREMRSGEDAYTRDYSAINQLVQKLAAVDLLLFDELGASKVSQWVYDNIYFLINRRYNNKKITCFAANFLDNPADGRESLAQRIGNRIRSRLYEMTFIVEIKGVDFRQKNLSGRRFK